MASEGGYESPRNKKVAADDPKGQKMECKYEQADFDKLKKAKSDALLNSILGLNHLRMLRSLAKQPGKR